MWSEIEIIVFCFQFDGVILDCAIKVLDQSKMPVIARGDAINVVRKLTAVVSLSTEVPLYVIDV